MWMGGAGGGVLGEYVLNKCIVKPNEADFSTLLAAEISTKYRDTTVPPIVRMDM